MATDPIPITTGNVAKLERVEDRSNDVAVVVDVLASTALFVGRLGVAVVVGVGVGVALLLILS
jgi:hypothetical protein